MTVPAGWYDDGSGQHRWWDGERWTEHRANGAWSDPASDHTGAAQAAAGSAEEAAGSAPAVTVAPTAPRKAPVLGFIGFGLAVLGTVLACIPAAFIVGAVLLAAGLVVSLIGVFQKNVARWPSIVGIVLSFVGGLIGTIILIVVVAANAVNAFDSAPPAAAPSASPVPERPAVEEIAEAFETQLLAGGITTYEGATRFYLSDAPDFYTCVAEQLYASDLTDEELHELVSSTDLAVFQEVAENTSPCEITSGPALEGDIHGAGKEIPIGSGMTVQFQVGTAQLDPPDPILPGAEVTEDDYSYAWGDAVETDGHVAVLTATVRNNGDSTHSDNGAYLDLRSASGETVIASAGMRGTELERGARFDSEEDVDNEGFNVDSVAPGQEKTFTQVVPLPPSEIDDVTVALLLVKDMGEGRSFTVT